MPWKSSIRPPGMIIVVSVSGIRTIRPSSSHNLVIGSTRDQSSRLRQIATSSTTVPCRTSWISSTVPRTGRRRSHVADNDGSFGAAR